MGIELRQIAPGDPAGHRRVVPAYRGSGVATQILKGGIPVDPGPQLESAVEPLIREASRLSFHNPRSRAFAQARLPGVYAARRPRKTAAPVSASIAAAASSQVLPAPSPLEAVEPSSG
jgi:hypothetical protein